MQHKLASFPVNKRAVKLLSLRSLSRPQILAEGHHTPSGAVGCSLSWEPGKFTLYYCHDLGFKSSRYNNFSYQSFIYSPTDATILKFTLKQIRHVSVLQVNTIIRERINLCLLHKLACWVSIILHIRTVQRLDIIRVLFIHQLMHQ
jgi:hypothetical protein